MVNLGNKKSQINITWDDVESSSIESIHYNNNGDTGVLGVIFKSGDSYIYDKVGINEIVNMLKSESVGSYFAKNIRSSYSYKNIGNTYGESPLKKIGIVS
jgi:hypothetical protein